VITIIKAIGAGVLALALKLLLSVLTVIFGALVGALAGSVIAFGTGVVFVTPLALIGAVTALVANVWENSK
jgi:hypothetical protein